MTTTEDEGPLPERLHDAARRYNEPLAVPREEMWRAIASGRERRRAARRRLRWGLGLAAMLVVGIGIGRMARPSGDAAVAAARAPESTSYGVAAGQCLARTEVLLTSFRGESRSGRLDPEFLASARDLLSTTRLLLDSPAADDARLAALLQDIELVLAQIGRFQAAPDRRDDLELINESINQSGMLTRLRAATPGAGVPARTEGAT